jgi:hypothetical protein
VRHPFSAAEFPREWLRVTRLHLVEGIATSITATPRRSVAKLLTKDEARRIANVAKLPGALAKGLARGKGPERAHGKKKAAQGDVWVG